MAEIYKYDSEKKIISKWEDLKMLAHFKNCYDYINRKRIALILQEQMQLCVCVRARTNLFAIFLSLRFLY